MAEFATPFLDILAGKKPGKIILRDDARNFALLESLHPEGAVHWLAIPYEPVPSIEELALTDRTRFLELIEFAMQETKARQADYAALSRGFTIKFHVGGYETVAHAKVHILSVE